MESQVSKKSINIKCIAIVEEEETEFEGTLKLKKNNNLVELYKKKYMLLGDIIEVRNTDSVESNLIYSELRYDSITYIDYIRKNYIWGEFKIEMVEVTEDYVILTLTDVNRIGKGRFKNEDIVDITINTNNYYDKDVKIVIKD